VASRGSRPRTRRSPSTATAQAAPRARSRRASTSCSSPGRCAPGPVASAQRVRHTARSLLWRRRFALAVAHLALGERRSACATCSNFRFGAGARAGRAVRWGAQGAPRQPSLRGRRQQGKPAELHPGGADLSERRARRIGEGQCARASRSKDACGTFARECVRSSWDALLPQLS
jgi:hypothetical protein